MMGHFFAVMWATNFGKAEREPFSISIRFDIATDTIFEDLACFKVEHDPAGTTKAQRWRTKTRTDGDGYDARSWEIVRDDGVFTVARLEAPDAFVNKFANVRNAKDTGWKSQLQAEDIIATSANQLRTRAGVWPTRVLGAAKNRLGLDGGSGTELEQVVNLLQGLTLDDDFSLVRNSYVDTLLATDSNRQITHWLLRDFGSAEEIANFGTIDVDRIYDMRQRMESVGLTHPMKYMHILYQAGVFARASTTLSSG